MLYLLLAVASSTGIIVLFKIFSRLKINTFYTILVNYVVAAAFGFLTESSNFSFAAIPSKPWFLLALASGLMFIVGFNLFALSARHAGVALTGMASRMSLIVAVVAGLIFFGDEAGIFRIVGIIIGLLAFYFSFYRDKLKPVSRKLALLPVALLVVHGFSDLLLKIGQEYCIGGEFGLFLATVFLTALLLGLIFLFVSGSYKVSFTYREVLAGIVIGLVNWYSGYFLLLGLDIFDVSFVIPFVNISIVALTAIIGFFVFKEKLKTLNWIGVGLALLAIFLMLQ
jgi:drug/metabolite transporter (DMT)-like permease